jgi:hypothetical protein
LLFLLIVAALEKNAPLQIPIPSEMPAFHGGQ